MDPEKTDPSSLLQEIEDERQGNAGRRAWNGVPQNPHETQHMLTGAANTIDRLLNRLAQLLTDHQQEKVELEKCLQRQWEERTHDENVARAQTKRAEAAESSLSRLRDEQAALLAALKGLEAAATNLSRDWRLQDDLMTCQCGHDEHEHETKEYRGNKSRWCQHRDGDVKCRCQGFIARPNPDPFDAHVQALTQSRAAIAKAEGR